MLGELYQYAIDHNLAARPGFKPKKPKAYVLIARDGSFIGIDPVDKTAEPVMAPDIGSAANGTKACNPLIEKASIPLLFAVKDDDLKKAQAKHPCFIRMLTDGAQAEPAFGIAASALENEDFRAAAVQALTAGKIKSSDPIGFKVDGMPLEASRLYSDWWGTYRLTISGKSSGKKISDPVCLITGEIAPALDTVPKVSGLRVVGGHTSGDAFLCFDKDAFQSYGLRQSLNAPVSEEAMAAVNAALTKLIADAGVIGGAKIVHWYSSEVQEEDDILPPLLGFMQWDDTDDSASSGEQDAKVRRAELENKAMQKAQSLCTSIQKGEMPELGNARYYVMPLSGAGGRMMVRGWQEGSFSDLCRSFNSWFDDIRLISWDGKGQTKNPKLMAMMIRLLKPGGDDKKVYDRVNSELSNLSMRILQAILNNTRLPDEIPVKALHWLMSGMQSGGNDKDGESKSRSSAIEYETMAYQWLKIWLLREQRAKGASVFMGEKLNPEYPGIAYQCGRLMAVYAEVQRKALGDDIGAGVIQRYFASASRAPGLVIGKLTTLCNHHLAKIENKGTVRRFENLLGDISTQIGSTPVPRMFTIEQQTEFALGYYQQKASIWQKTETATVNTETDDN